VAFSHCIRSSSSEGMDKDGVRSNLDTFFAFVSQSGPDNVGEAKYGTKAWDEYESLSPDHNRRRTNNILEATGRSLTGMERSPGVVSIFAFLFGI
jgi:hypothetical protein